MIKFQALGYPYATVFAKSISKTKDFPYLSAIDINGNRATLAFYTNQENGFSALDIEHFNRSFEEHIFIFDYSDNASFKKIKQLIKTESRYNSNNFMVFGIECSPLKVSVEDKHVTKFSQKYDLQVNKVSLDNPAEIKILLGNFVDPILKKLKAQESERPPIVRTTLALEKQVKPSPGIPTQDIATLTPTSRDEKADGVINDVYGEERLWLKLQVDASSTSSSSSSSSNASSAASSEFSLFDTFRNILRPSAKKNHKPATPASSSISVPPFAYHEKICVLNLIAVLSDINKELLKTLPSNAPVVKRRAALVSMREDIDQYTKVKHQGDLAETEIEVRKILVETINDVTEDQKIRERLLKEERAFDHIMTLDNAQEYKINLLNFKKQCLIVLHKANHDKSEDVNKLKVSLS